MKLIKILDKKFQLVIQNSVITKTIERLAKEMNKDLEGKNPLFISILNGSFIFAADLYKRISLLDSEITFVRLASYDNDTSTGKVKELIGLNETIEERTVVVLEDIVDTGATLERVIGELKLRKAADIKICTLLFKPEAYTKNIPIDYIGFKIANNFVVGYGLDYDGYGRNLMAIYKLIK